MKDIGAFSKSNYDDESINHNKRPQDFDSPSQMKGIAIRPNFDDSSSYSTDYENRDEGYQSLSDRVDDDRQCSEVVLNFNDIRDFDDYFWGFGRIIGSNCSIIFVQIYSKKKTRSW